MKKSTWLEIIDVFDSITEAKTEVSKTHIRWGFLMPLNDKQFNTFCDFFEDYNDVIKRHVRVRIHEASLVVEVRKSLVHKKLNRKEIPSLIDSDWPVPNTMYKLFADITATLQQLEIAFDSKITLSRAFKRGWQWERDVAYATFLTIRRGERYVSESNMDIDFLLGALISHTK